MPMYSDAVRYTLLGDDRFPVWGTVMQKRHLAPAWPESLPEPQLPLMLAQYRAVSWNRLPTVLRSGVDVEPSDAPLYLSDWEKAWEYGGFPKVVFALTTSTLKRSFHSLPPDADVAEIARWQRTFPHRLDLPSGMIWLTLFDPKKSSGPAYEVAHGWYVPGDPATACVGVFLHGSEDHVAEARDLLAALNA